MLHSQDDFDLPVFDRPMPDPPSTVPYESAVRSFEEFIAAYHLRETSPPMKDIPEFKL